MKLLDIIRRKALPGPWSEGDKIPWNEPGFSKRMLREHLSQEHDLASHRVETIDNRVQWIHDQVLGGRESRILDLGCGPGFYTNRFAKLGHSCRGIDFSPASIEYARDRANGDSLDCMYIEDDLRSAEFGEDYDLVMLIFGEFNVFRRSDIEAVLGKVHAALKAKGRILIEPQSYQAVKNAGLSQPTWSSSERGLFMDAPHIHLREAFWYKDVNVTVERYYVIDAATAEVTMHTQSVKAYKDEEYRELLTSCGFSDIDFLESMDGRADSINENLRVILATKR
jgi:SAM-dependent methyltransferase